ncbi:MAG: DUF4874 domain-containing protein, partial [Clostridia bacterium]
MNNKKNKLIKFIATMLLLAIALVCFCGCSKFTFEQYGKIDTEFAKSIDNNLAILGCDESLLKNPNRGFRGEMYITLGSNVAYPSSKDDPYKQILEETNYKDLSVNVVQTYVYLLEFYDKDLTEEALVQMKLFFEKVEESGVKMLLRFAYEHNADMKKGPTTSQILKHCAQLKKWFSENEKLAYNTIYSMQLGMIGLWGEGHSSVNNHDVGKIATAVSEMTPKNINIMIRTPEMYNQIPKSIRYRFTIHDDFLVGEYHPWGISIKPTNPQYQQVLNVTKHHLTDGEMPWGRDKTVDHINPILFLKQVVGYGLTTLSAKHNYMEGENYLEYELYKWKNQFITKQQLEENHFPYNPFMLKEDKITIFDYLNYHLGYQIALSNLEISQNHIAFQLNNFGFACPIGYNMLVYVDGKVVYEKLVEDMQLYQFGQFQVQIPNIILDKNSTIGVQF